MFDLFVSDVLRLSHLLAVAVGFGVAAETEIFMLKRRRTVISPGLMSGLKHRHNVILYALGAMWVTGAALIALRTGFVLSAFTPKLWAKISVVTILSLNALAVARVAMPILARQAGRRISSLPLPTRRALFAVAGVSATSWMIAIVLGSSVLLKTGPAWFFELALPFAYLAGIGVAMLVGQRLYTSEVSRAPAIQPAEHVQKFKRPKPPRTAVSELHVPAPQPAQNGPQPTAAKPKIPPPEPAAQSAHQKPRRPKPRPAAPQVEVRASDLAIAFPQKLKRKPRLKVDPVEAPRLSPAQKAARQHLAEVAAELTGSR